VKSIKRAFFPRYFINDANIFGKCIGGVNDFFLIDQVILPPSANIVGVAQGAEDFSILVQAVLAADPVVAQVLSDENSTYTVFAPNNQAFADLLAALGVASLDELIGAVGIDGLTTVLTYHVAEVCAFSNDLTDGMIITTLQGESIEVDLVNGQLIDKTDTPKSLGPNLDIRASNGVIHEISGVLLPQAVIDAL
jgi:transforming growth factor-beta-induced protein